MDTIPGLCYVHSYLNHSEQEALLQAIDQQPWLTAWKRRTQQYGYQHQARPHALQPLAPLPTWLATLGQRLQQEGWLSQAPQQVTINEYEPGQGIARHRDCRCFGATIAVISLLSPCVMVWTPTPPGHSVPVLLYPGSLLLLQGEARSRWRHSIPARQSDVVDGVRIMRKRRVSVSFRSLLNKA